MNCLDKDRQPALSVKTEDVLNSQVLHASVGS